eukprot:PRCOL_00004572-RA
MLGGAELELGAAQRAAAAYVEALLSQGAPAVSPDEAARGTAVDARASPSQSAEGGGEGETDALASANAAAPASAGESTSTREAAVAARQRVALAAIWELLSVLVGGLAGDVTHAVRWYDARSRVALKQICMWTGLPWPRVGALETLACDGLAQLRTPTRIQDNTDGSDTPTGDDVRAQLRAEVVQSSEGGALGVRLAKVTAAAALGGAALALTGGLAAPAIAVGISTAASSGVAASVGAGAALSAVAGGLGTSAGAAGITAGLGGWGATKMANKMLRRTQPVREYGLLALGPASQLEAARVREVERALACRTDDGVRLEVPPLPLAAAGSNLAVLVCVSGWVASRAGYVEPWHKGLPSAQDGAADRDAYALVWEADELVSLGTALASFLASQTVQEAIKQFAAHTVAGALVASFAWPFAALSAMAPVDNAWSIALVRSEVCGALIARQILENRFADRPVSLVGYSMGARAIFHCLLHLEEAGFTGAVEDVFLLGSPMSASDTEAWQRARSVVAGRLVNGFSTKDGLLALVYRGTHLDTPAGLSPVGVPGVEDVNLTRVVSSHSDYAENTDACVEACRV